MSALTTVHALEKTVASTLGERLTEQAKRYAGKMLLATDQRRVSYEQMETISQSVAHGFQNLGVGKGDVVCQMLPNCEEFIFNWLGLAKIGAINAPLNPQFSGQALLRLINHTETRVLVLEESLESAIVAIEPHLEHLEHIIYRARDGFVPDARLSRFSHSRLDSLIQTGGRPVPVPVKFSDPVMILFTSGSTGPSKAVEWSHRYALHYAAEYIEHWELVEQDVLYTAYPLFHVDAAVSTFLTALHRGASAVVMSKFSVNRFWDDIREHGATITTFMGAVAVFLFNKPERDDDAENSLRLVLMAPVPDFWRAFERRFGVQVVSGYGSTEACFPCWPDLTQPHVDNTCGKPCQHYDLVVADEFDVPQPTGVIGEILVRPKVAYTMMSGYYKDPAATMEAWRNLWYHSGDLAYLDEAGFLHFVGRKKDSIRRRGEFISSFEVEEVLDQHPEVLACAVFGVPSEYTEEEVKAVIVARRTLSPEDVTQWARGRLPRYALPRFLEFVERLPVTETGKVRKSDLKKDWHNPQTFDRDCGIYLSRRREMAQGSEGVDEHR